MVTRTFCPHCSQLMPDLRFGVAFSPLKTRIIDIVKRSGGVGISGDDLGRMIYGDDSGRMLYGSASYSDRIKNHIHQLNTMLVHQDWRVRGTKHYGYKLIKEPPK